MERERRRERIKTHVSMRVRVVSKVVKKWLYKYHFSLWSSDRLLPQLYTTVTIASTDLLSKILLQQKLVDQASKN